MKKQTNCSTLASTRKEKIIYGIGNIGNCSWLLTSSFLTIYYTDSVGLGAAYMGTMMLICRLFDGISDILMGTLIDKTRSKWGKARPWLLFMMVPLNIAVFLMFCVPAGFNGTSKNIYAFITYFLVTVVFYTAVNISYQSLLPRFSLSSQDRNVTNIIRTAMDIVSTIAFSAIVPMVLSANGGYQSQKAWSLIVGILCIISVVCYTACFLGIKEKAPMDTIDTDGNRTKAPLKTGIKMLLSSRYFYISAFLSLAFAVSGGATGVNIYFARDVLGNDSYFGFMTALSFGPMMLGLPFIPMLFKKFGKRTTICTGLIFSVVAGLVNLANPYNTSLYFVTAFIRSFAASPLTASLMTLPGDIVDYNHWKTGIRIEGITTSANSLGTKLGTGLGAALLGWLLAWGGYNGAAAVQTQDALNSIIFMAIGLPAIITGIAFILMLFWNIEKYQPEITSFMEDQQAKNETTFE